MWHLIEKIKLTTLSINLNQNYVLYLILRLFYFILFILFYSILTNSYLRNLRNIVCHSDKILKDIQM